MAPATARGRGPRGLGGGGRPAVGRPQAGRGARGAAKGTLGDKTGGFLDLAALVAADGKKAGAFDGLARPLGDDVYVDVQGWKLYLRDLTAAEGVKMNVALANALGPMVLKGGYDEREVADLLRQVGVKLGGGKVQLPLADLIPSYPAQDLQDIVRRWADDQ